MRNRMIVLCGFTCVAATVSIALGQASICFKYGAIDYDQPPANQPGPGCGTYVECPTGFRCLTGRASKKVSNPFTSTVNCTTLGGGQGTAPNCVLGVPVFPQPGTAGTATVVDQNCWGGCMSGPPA